MSLIVAEYECPVHGRFERTVERDENGDAPDEVACIEEEPCDRFCDRCDLGSEHSNRCGLTSPWVISAPMGRVRPGEVVRGKSEERPSDRYVLNTEKLADGMPLHEWKAERAKVHRDESLRRVRKAFGRTGKTFVGGR